MCRTIRNIWRKYIIPILQQLNPIPVFGLFGFLAFVVAIVGLSLFWFITELTTTNVPNPLINSQYTPGFGAILAGTSGSLFSLAGFIMLYETMRRQRNSFQVQQFEMRFLQMIQIHRDNIAEMTHIRPQDGKEVTGRQVFIEVINQFWLAYERIRYTQIREQGGRRFVQREAIGVAFLATFFGVSESSKSSLEPRIEEIVENGSDRLITRLRQIRRRRRNQDETTDERLILTGHITLLGHYYRHLYQTVLYVDKQPFLTQKEKLQYIKLLRAQLSNEEQICLFINSLSPLGWVWGTPWTHHVSQDSSLMMKYKMIKNIPRKALFNIDPKDFYPMKFEHEEERDKTDRPGPPVKRRIF